MYTVFCARFGELDTELWIDEAANPLEAIAMVRDAGALRPVHEPTGERAQWSGATVADLHGQIERFFQLHKYLLDGTITPCESLAGPTGAPWTPVGG